VPESEAALPQSGVCEKTDPFLVARLAEVLREAFRLPHFDYHERSALRKITGYDAGSFVRFVLALEAEFGITLHEDDVDQIETMGDVLALLRNTNGRND
jgi:acyl carrier protein